MLKYLNFNHHRHFPGPPCCEQDEQRLTAHLFRNRRAPSGTGAALKDIVAAAATGSRRGSRSVGALRREMTLIRELC